MNECEPPKPVDRPGPPRLFISYKHNADPDQKIATEVYEALKQNHDVFIDQKILPGTRWAERIQKEIRQSDFLITFLSEHSVLSEMVVGEIQLAHEMSKDQGRPSIIPVRLDYREPFKYPLSVYVDPIHWISWDSADATERLIHELRLAISGHALPVNDALEPKTDSDQSSTFPHPLPQAQPLSFEMPEGTMDTQSQFYILRPSDSAAHETIKRQGETMTIKGPRQMGKSSLLIRTISAAYQVGKRVAFLDFQLMDNSSMADADCFFRRFCSWVTDELDMEDRVEEHWKLPLGNTQRCTRYMGRYLLKELDCPLVLAMDEVDSVSNPDLRSDFFGMLRAWHNKSATSAVWKQLDLALVTSTEPYQLIKNPNQSPFNVGLNIELKDFAAEQVADLNRRHGSPLNYDEINRLMKLLSGHPYLVRRALYLVASNSMSINDVFATASDDRGPFGDHLRYHLMRIHTDKELVAGLKRIITHKTCEDETLFFRLHGAGLVRRENGAVIPRCQLYADYFQEHVR